MLRNKLRQYLSKYSCFNAEDKEDLIASVFLGLSVYKDKDQTEALKKIEKAT